MVVEKVLSSASSFFLFCVRKHVFCCKFCFNPVLKDIFIMLTLREAIAVHVLLNFMPQICADQADRKNVQHYMRENSFKFMLIENVYIKQTFFGVIFSPPSIISSYILLVQTHAITE